MTISGIRLTPLYAAALALALPVSAMAAGEPSKPHDCGDGRKMEVVQPKDGVMEARVDDLIVRISVRDGGPLRPAKYYVRVLKGEQQVESGSTREADETLPRACRLIAGYYSALDRARRAPSAEELRKQLFEYYDGL